ncbi:MAG: metallophosphoesterase [Methylococcaceae bacterium]|jgi:hypothetical protein
MPKTIGWLHLSDLHFLEKHDWRDNPVLDKLCADVSLLKNAGLLIDLVFCTGDIGYGETSSNPLDEQYSDAMSFFDKVLNICGLERNRLFLVPGNHDIDRSCILDSQTNFFRSDERRVKDINQMFRNRNPDVQAAMRRLQNYRSFVKTHFKHISLDDNTNFGTFIEINGLNIYIAGLNSAWTCADKMDKANLWLAGKSQVYACKNMATNVPSAEKTAIKIALIHHQLDWLNPAEVRDIRSTIQNEFDFLLHGHEHDQWVIENRTPYHIVIASGAASADSEEELGYNLVQLGSNTADIHLQKYDKKGEGWVKENIAYRAKDGIWSILSPPVLSKEDNLISDQLKTQLADVNIIINELTQNQFDIIKWLSDYDQAAISGCAGSGKTLLAVEKAIRLDNEKIKTLILCHNPNLANFIRFLVAKTTIKVDDFMSWITQIVEEKEITDRSWTKYEEPTKDDIISAFNILSESIESNKFGAIIVDEGQDFREDWWLVVKAALRDEKKGTLLIFYDDNQALLPQRSKYPIKDLSSKLSKNCRNAGAIFNVVRRFHNHAPEPSLFLKDTGVFQKWVFDFGEEYQVLNEAIKAALEIIPPEKLVVLTTEPEPIEKSVLKDQEIHITPFAKWQDGIGMCFSKLSGWVNNAKRKHTEQPMIQPSLSHATSPTENDIISISNVAKNILTYFEYNIENPPNTYHDYGLWYVYHNDTICFHDRKIIDILYSLYRRDWVKHLPKLTPLKLVAGDLPNARFC